MYYPDEVIEEVRTKNDIVSVISQYVRLTKRGGNYFGVCPFHNEKTPSFSVSPGKQMYYCFGCGAGGNVLTFVMQYENYTFTEAMQNLAERAGITLPQAEETEETEAAGRSSDASVGSEQGGCPLLLLPAADAGGNARDGISEEPEPER